MTSTFHHFHPVEDYVQASDSAENAYNIAPCKSGNGSDNGLLNYSIPEYDTMNKAGILALLTGAHGG